MTWSNDELITKDEASKRIKEDSQERGYVNYKVFYDGNVIPRPSDLPELVDYSKITISAVMDQAN